MPEGDRKKLIPFKLLTPEDARKQKLHQSKRKALSATAKKRIQYTLLAFFISLLLAGDGGFFYLLFRKPPGTFDVVLDPNTGKIIKDNRITKTVTKTTRDRVGKVPPPRTRIITRTKTVKETVTRTSTRKETKTEFRDKPCPPEKDRPCPPCAPDKACPPPPPDKPCPPCPPEKPCPPCDNGGGRKKKGKFPFGLADL